MDGSGVPVKTIVTQYRRLVVGDVAISWRVHSDFCVLVTSEYQNDNRRGANGRANGSSRYI